MAKARQPDQTERLARLGEYHRALAGFSRAASALLPRDRLLQHICAVVSGVTNIRHVKIMRHRPDHGDLLLEAGVGWKPGVVGHQTFALVLDEPPGRAMQMGAPLAVQDIRKDAEYRLTPILAEHGIVSLLNVPVRIDGRVWGLLEVDTDEPRVFDDDDITFLTAAANILGVGLARLETQEKLEHSAAERSRENAFHKVVLREFKHRVKNNLQTIIAFLSLQRRQAGARDETGVISTIMNRVHAIALAQDQLSFTDDIREVDFADYLQALCANIDPHQERVTVELDVKGDIRLSLDRAVPVGLIVNELVTNAFKYAFDDAGGSIRVSFGIAVEIAEALLVVEDDGKGMGTPRPGGLGLQLVKTLAAQVNGQFAQETVARGTRFCLRFPVQA